MSSGLCHNLCSKLPKRVKMYVEEREALRLSSVRPPEKVKVPIYLCRACARELGYAEVTK
jgi:hypothetical protein